MEGNFLRPGDQVYVCRTTMCHGTTWDYKVYLVYLGRLPIHTLGSLRSPIGMPKCALLSCRGYNPQNSFDKRSCSMASRGIGLILNSHLDDLPCLDRVILGGLSLGDKLGTAV